MRISLVYDSKAGNAKFYLKRVVSKIWMRERVYIPVSKILKIWPSHIYINQLLLIN